ncbi:glycosyltransferase family 4 protein [Corynebacterium sp. 335C]
MRVAIVAESFLPNMNGVTNSILRVLDHLADHGHDALVIAPGARTHQDEVESYRGFRIARVPTVMVPFIDSLPIGVPNSTLAVELRRFGPDVVHLASPFVLGAAGAFTARALGIPAVAVYQTDVAGFANNYRLKGLGSAAWGWTRVIHNSCARTLAPSTSTIRDLMAHGIRDIHRWGRGVDGVRFHPSKRSEALRRMWNPDGRPIVGYVGRLAAEKSVQRLAEVAEDGRWQVVVVGDGPERKDLAAAMPSAVFTGQLGGDELARAYASLDLFVHTGEYETFCQAVQEAHASGVPAIAPDAGGPRDLIHAGVDGELLPVDGFAAALPAAVARWTGNVAGPELRDACRASVEGRTWASLCDDLLGHYAAVAGLGAARANLAA